MKEVHKRRQEKAGITDMVIRLAVNGIVDI